MPFAATVTVPCNGEVFEVTVRPVPTSLDNTVVPASATPAAVVPESFVVVGVMLTFTVPVAVPPWPSEMV